MVCVGFGYAKTRNDSERNIDQKEGGVGKLGLILEILLRALQLRFHLGRFQTFGLNDLEVTPPFEALPGHREYDLNQE